MELIDIGANLTHESFSSDLRQVIEDAKNANISHIILTGTDLKTSLAAKELSAFFCGASSAWTWASGMMSTEEMEEVFNKFKRRNIWERPGRKWNRSPIY